MDLIRNTYLTRRFFLCLTIIILVFVTAYFFPVLNVAGRYLLLILIVTIFFDTYLLFHPNNSVKAIRHVPEMLSNGDKNEVTILIQNNYNFKINGYLIDEIPFVFQIRDFNIPFKLEKRNQQKIVYSLYPKKRGDYTFGYLNVYVSNSIKLISRRFRFADQVSAVVYPSIIQMRAYELFSISNRLTEIGIKRIRRIGHTMEFDQIRNYVKGDDYRTINWKATAHKHQLMVNQYDDEKSQHVYSVIDMGRSMKMPFDNMTLLDYAINSSLVISNIAIKKYDKAGLLTFSNELNTLLQASARKDTMTKILQALYKQTTHFLESDYEKLFTVISYRIKQRSLFLLFTNFESISSLQRQLHIFREINKRHVLVIIIFENKELTRFAEKNAVNIEDIYKKTVAEKLIFEKKQIIKELNTHGIQGILVQPQQLTIAVINKYLELKARAIL